MVFGERKNGGQEIFDSVREGEGSERESGDWGWSPEAFEIY